MTLIPNQEAEKAAHEESVKLPGKLSQDSFRRGYRKATESANEKLQTDYLPVLLKCKEALELAINIKDLWIVSGTVKPEHEGEAIALCQMQSKIESTLSQLKDLEL